MARRDSSSLIALSTLRELEADRVRHDHQVRSAAAEAERLAREREQQRVREAYERAAAEEAERAHAELLARLERERQDRLRIAEAEARARAEHDARLRQEQLRLAAQVRMSEQRAKPRWPLAVVPTLVLALLGTGAIVWHGQQREAMERESAERIAMEQNQALAAVNAKLDALEAEQARLQNERAALEAELAAAAGDEAAQADVLAKIDAVDERISGNDEARGKPSRPKRPRVGKPVTDETKPVKPPRTRPVLEVGDTKDPLGGIN
jgi:colicin import membrane protein